jgi:nucleoid-associated protein YgaU
MVNFCLLRSIAAVDPGPGGLIMTATSIVRIVVPCIALVGGCAAAFIYGPTPVRREASVETTASTLAPAQPAFAPQASGSPALAPAQAEVAAVAADLAGSDMTRSGSTRRATGEESLPAFDIARVEQSGEAVIAGRAAPGSTVELLRNGERIESAVADAAGQFVIVSPQLPAGSYELHLRAKSADGTIAVSKHGVPVAVNETGATPDAAKARAELSKVAANATKASSQDQSAGFSHSPQLSESRVHVATAQAGAVAPRSPTEQSHSMAATTPSDTASSSHAGRPSVSTKLVSRGDSLWRISRLTYGSGMQYAVVYKANRDRIKNPNLIYPGQVFVLPTK